MKKRHGVEQIVAKLCQAGVELGKELKVLEVCKTIGISEQPYYRWRTKYGEMDPQMVKKLRVMLLDSVAHSSLQRCSPPQLATPTVPPLQIAVWIKRWGWDSNPR